MSLSHGWLGRITQAQILFPALVLLLLGMLWGTVFYLLRAERAAAEREATVLTRELVETYEAQVVRALREIDQTLKFVQFAHNTTRNPNALLRDLKSRSILPHELLFAVSIVDATGRITASTRGRAGAQVGDADYFRAHRADPQSALVVGQPPHGTAGEGQLHFTRRLQRPDGSFAGIVVVSVDAAYFVSGYESAKLGKQGLLGLLGTDGVFRARRTGNRVHTGETTNYGALVGETQPDVTDPVMLFTILDDVQRYMTARELYEFPVAVVVGLSQEEQLAKVEQSKQRYLWWASFGSVLIVLLMSILGRMSWQLARSRVRETEAAVAHAKRVEYLAFHDGLTGLPNRSLFSKLLIQSIAQAQRHNRHLGVLFLDLDRFKGINDTLGHDAGDELLREVANRLKSCLRESDTVARLGGDEFVVLLAELADEKYAAIVANKILVATAKPFLLLGNEFTVTASVGISIFPQDGTDEQTLTKNADIAMYHAKERGKNNYQYFSQALGSNVLGRMALEGSMRQALQRNEFQLHYQPKRNLGDSSVSGVEALLRWQHPDLGLIAPMQFLPVAEETGLIVPIGKWVIRAACEQNMAWQHQGFAPLSIAVNISPRQFFDDQLLPDIQVILKTTGMAPPLLELEITEGLLMHDVEKAMRVLMALKQTGVRIAIDDFGVGYSSLATLQRFPIDTVKIDRSFIRDAAEGGDQKSLTGAIIAMGRSLSLNIVAQGVETKEQADYLRDRACDELQGFYFDQPAPAEQLTPLLRKQGS
ncbi:MAG TPA: EAL domain-containing protein [Burkholderiales bacterium]|nr:EAL domain-containing protein [Burkholderiales bacterium]